MWHMWIAPIRSPARSLGTQERVPKKSRTILSRDLALRKRRGAPQKVVYAHRSTKK
jgi:hypothetical protein